MRREAIALILVAGLALTVPATRALPPEEAFTIHLDAAGHFRLGLLAVGVGAVDDDDPVPRAGVGAINFAAYEVDVDDCRRDLRFMLDFQPRNASADAGLVYLAFPFQFQARLYDAETGTALPGGTLNWQVPGTQRYNLETGLRLRVELFMQRGLEADYTLRIAGWKDLTAECNWRGLVFINEVEANPQGPDAGNEWIELVNHGFQTADLSGWTLASTHGQTNVHVFPGGTLLEPGAHLLVQFPGQFIDNTDEVLVLTGARGWEIDRTPALNDRANDARTWQRTPDGAENWTFATGTPGAPNA